MGLPQSCIPLGGRQLGAAALSPQHVGPIPDQQLRQTDKHLLETEIFLQLLYFPTFLITN